MPAFPRLDYLSLRFIDLLLVDWEGGELLELFLGLGGARHPGIASQQLRRGPQAAALGLPHRCSKCVQSVRRLAASEVPWSMAAHARAGCR